MSRIFKTLKGNLLFFLCVFSGMISSVIFAGEGTPYVNALLYSEVRIFVQYAQIVLFILKEFLALLTFAGIFIAAKWIFIRVICLFIDYFLTTKSKLKITKRKRPSDVICFFESRQKLFGRFNL